jgi:ribosomal-protein-alanine N-acetyltransferase
MSVPPILFVAGNGNGSKHFMQSERLLFKTWDGSMEVLAEELWGNADVTALIGGPFSADQVESRLQREVGTQASCNVQYWPIFDKTSDRFIGCCGLRPRDLANGQYELGFHLLPAIWGQGYAYEAARRVCEHAFTTLCATSLFAGHNPANESSKKLLHKLGFEFTHTEYYAPTGLDHPSYLLTKEAFCSK